MQVVGVETRVADDTSRAKSVGIDAVRGVQHDIALKPYEGRYKVYIICDAERLTEDAANSLLKTLEEPPPHSVLILVASQESELPETVVSRCQRVRLYPPSRVEIRAALDALGVPDERASLLAALSQGRAGWALEAAQGDADVLEDRRAAVDECVKLGSVGTVDRLAVAAELDRRYNKGDRLSVVAVLTFWMSWWRDVLLAKAGCMDLVANFDYHTELSRVSGRLDLAQIQGALKDLSRTLAELEQNVNPRLALDGLVLRLPHVEV